MAYYCGDIGIDIDLYYRSTMRELACVSFGYEMKQRREWEKARIISFFSAVQCLKKGAKPQDLMPFDWDSEEIDEDKLLAEVEKSKEFWKKIDDGKTDS